MKLPTIKASEWMTAIEKLNVRKAYRPPGGNTLKEIAAECGRSLPSAQRYVTALLDAGKAKMVEGTTVTVQNALRKTPYYVLVKGTKCQK